MTWIYSIFKGFLVESWTRHFSLTGLVGVRPTWELQARRLIQTQAFYWNTNLIFRFPQGGRKKTRLFMVYVSYQGGGVIRPLFLKKSTSFRRLALKNLFIQNKSVLSTLVWEQVLMIFFLNMYFFLFFFPKSGLRGWDQSLGDMSSKKSSFCRPPLSKLCNYFWNGIIK